MKNTQKSFRSISLAVAAIAALAAVPAAATPDVVSYAARVETSGAPFNGTVSITFALYDAATAGTEVWSESAPSVIVVDGDLVHDLGSVEPLDDTVLGRDTLFLEVTLNGDTLSPRSAVRAVPFALRARDAETLGGLAVDDLVTKSEIDGRLVQFADLSGVPAGFADNVDNDTIATAAAGGGLSATNNAFSVADNGITLAKMADGSVGSAEIVDSSVTAADLGVSSVGTSEITDASITAADLASNSVTSAKLSGTEVRVRRLPLPEINGDVREVCGVGLTVESSCRTIACNRDNTNNVVFFSCAGVCSATAPTDCELTDDNAPVVGLLLSPSN